MISLAPPCPWGAASVWAGAPQVAEAGGCSPSLHGTHKGTPSSPTSCRAPPPSYFTYFSATASLHLEHSAVRMLFPVQEETISFPLDTGSVSIPALCVLGSISLLPVPCFLLIILLEFLTFK